MLKGLLLKESLNDFHILDILKVIKTETWNAQNPTADQPAVWTALSFEVDESQADRIAEQLSQALKPKGWYINGSTDTTAYVVFPQKVFKYPIGDAEQRAIARQYGQSINIPDDQLDWGD